MHPDEKRGTGSLVSGRRNYAQQRDVRWAIFVCAAKHEDVTLLVCERQKRHCAKHGKLVCLPNSVFLVRRVAPSRTIIGTGTTLRPAASLAFGATGRPLGQTSIRRLLRWGYRSRSA